MPSSSLNTKQIIQNIEVLASAPAEKNIDSLTGLRFYAAFAVFLSHMYHFKYFGLPDSALLTIISSFGNLGVSLFYVLSGFVLYVRYAHAAIGPSRLKNFYVARLARIYPVFLITAAMAIPIEYFSSFRSQLPLTLGTTASLTHCLFPQTCVRLNDVGWSIGVEAFFYLLFPFLLAKFTKLHHLIGIIAAVALLIAAGQTLFPENFYASNRFFVNRTPEFLLGMATGWLYLKNSPFLTIKHQILIVGVILSFFSMLVIPLLVKEFNWMSHNYLFFMWPSATLIFLLAQLERNKVPLALFASGLIVYGGEISYSFYLTHNLLLRYMEHGLAILCKLDVGNTSLWLQVGLALIALVISILASCLLYRIIEVPCRRKIRQLLVTCPRMASNPRET